MRVSNVPNRRARKTPPSTLLNVKRSERERGLARHFNPLVLSSVECQPISRVRPLFNPPFPSQRLYVKYESRGGNIKCLHCSHDPPRTGREGKRETSDLFQVHRNIAAFTTNPVENRILSLSHSEEERVKILEVEIEPIGDFSHLYPRSARLPSLSRREQGPRKNHIWREFEEERASRDPFLLGSDPTSPSRSNTINRRLPSSTPRAT